MTRDDIEIDVADGVLTLKGEKKEEKEQQPEHYRVVERSYGAFERSFTLPRFVTAEKISAEFAAGVLKVHMPKDEQTQGRRVDIKARYSWLRVHSGRPGTRGRRIMKAKDIMSRTLHVVTPDERVSHAAELMAREHVGMVPVVDSQDTMHIMGVITDRDIAVRHVVTHHDGDCPVHGHMTRAGIVTAHDNDHVHDIMGRMRRQLRRIPVVNDQHELVGVVARADVALKVGHRNLWHSSS